MKAQLMSDLHSEFYPEPLKFLKSLSFEPNLDFLILPGDIVVPCRQKPRDILMVLDYLGSKAKHIIFTEGNHELYGGTKEQAETILKTWIPPNFHWLQDSEETIEGVHFFGGTLWFSYSSDNYKYQHQLNDFSQIPDLEEWVYESNDSFRSAAHRLIRPETLVLSHHVPSLKAVHPDFQGSELNRFFVSDLTETIKEKMPRYWFFGHSHRPYSCRVGKTHLLCNPFGYSHERRSVLTYPRMVIEL